MSKIIVPDQFRKKQAEHNSIQRSYEIDRFRQANGLTQVISFENSPIVVGVDSDGTMAKVYVGRSLTDENLVFHGAVRLEYLPVWIRGFHAAFDYCSEKP